MLAAADNLVAEATTGHTRLRIGHAWAAMGRHTREFQRRWAARYPDVELELIRTNSPTGGLAEGLCDIAVLRIPADAQALRQRRRGPGTPVLRPRGRRPVGQAALDPPQRDPAAHAADRPAHRDPPPRTCGQPTRSPDIQDTRDIDDWLAIIAAGGGVGITPEGTTTQYRRDGIVFRPLRDAPLVTVQMIWRRHDPHPSTHAAVALLAELYRGT